MLTRRVITCLDVRAGRVVKGVRFDALREGRRSGRVSGNMKSRGADEIVMLDVSATLEDRLAGVRSVERIRARRLARSACLPRSTSWWCRRRGVEPAGLMASLEREIHAATPDSPSYDAASLEERLDRQSRKGRFLVELAVLCAALTLLLALASLHGAVAGGALSLRGGAVLAGIGVALGLVATFVLSRRLAPGWWMG